MKASRYIGVSFLQGKIQIAEIEHRKKKLTMTALAERDASLDIAGDGARLSADHPQLASFVQELRDLIRRNKISAEEISFALPMDPLFVNIIPVDSSLRGKELAQYLQWEVQQYFPDASPREFVNDSHGLPVEQGSAQETFMVAVRRGMVAFLQRAAGALKLKLKIVDIDHFSTEKALITNYPEILEHDIVLLGLQYSRVDASLIHNGQMTDYRAFMYSNTPDPVEPVLKYLKYLKQKNNSKPAAMLLHGNGVAKDLVVSLRKATGIKQTLPLNVFRKIKGAEDLLEPYVKESYRFAPAVGLALRAK
jgi:Tfp pilus assembly PilM family ATPase